MRTNGKRRIGWLAAGMLSALSLAACSDSTGPGGDMDPTEAEAIALFVVDVDATAGWSASVLTDQRPGSRDFSRVVDCPAGGTRSTTGEGSASLNADTRVLSTTWSTTLAHDECAFTRSRRDQAITTVIDGSVTASGAASYQLPADRNGRREILSYAATRIGSTTTTVGDRSRTCEVNVSETFNPSTGAFTVTGTVCGREVNVTRTPGAKRDG